MIGKGVGVEKNPESQKSRNRYESTMSIIESENPETYKALSTKGQIPSNRDRTVFTNTRKIVKYHQKNPVYGRDDQTQVYNLV